MQVLYFEHHFSSPTKFIQDNMSALSCFLVSIGAVLAIIDQYSNHTMYMICS